MHKNNSGYTLHAQAETHLQEETLSENCILFSNSAFIELVQICLQLIKSNSYAFIVNQIYTFLCGDQPYRIWSTSIFREPQNNDVLYSHDTETDALRMLNSQ
jgi:hypothetical protein